jgi:hypothetical protein
MHDPLVLVLYLQAILVWKLEDDSGPRTCSTADYVTYILFAMHPVALYPRTCLVRYIHGCSRSRTAE